MGVHKRDYLTEKQIKAIQLMVDTDWSRQKIADEVGCARSTLYEWLSDKNFKKKLIEYSDRLVIDARVDSIRRIKELMRQDEDKRTALASARFIAELNGLNTTIKHELKTCEEIHVKLAD